MPYHPPIPSYAMKGQIQDFAEMMATRLNFRPAAAIDPIVSILGGKVLFRDAVDEENPDSIIVEPDGSFQIFLTTLTSAKRDRFTIAHELGHLLVHFPIVSARFPDDGMEASRWVDNDNPEQQRAEWEANWFAAAFLMPKDAFRQAWTTLRDLNAVALVFDVSIKAAAVRAKSLGIAAG